MIEDFLNLPPVATTPVANHELRISPWIFEKIRNGHHGKLSCLGETDSWKKTRSRKSHDTVPLSGKVSLSFTQQWRQWEKQNSRMTNCWAGRSACHLPFTSNNTSEKDRIAERRVVERIGQLVQWERQNSRMSCCWVGRSVCHSPFSSNDDREKDRITEWRFVERVGQIVTYLSPAMTTVRKTEQQNDVLFCHSPFSSNDDREKDRTAEWPVVERDMSACYLPFPSNDNGEKDRTAEWRIVEWDA